MCEDFYFSVLGRKLLRLHCFYKLSQMNDYLLILHLYFNIYIIHDHTQYS